MIDTGDNWANIKIPKSRAKGFYLGYIFHGFSKYEQKMVTQA